MLARPEHIALSYNRHAPHALQKRIGKPANIDHAGPLLRAVLYVWGKSVQSCAYCEKVSGKEVSGKVFKAIAPTRQRPPSLND